MAIRVRRGTNAQRLPVVLEEGEIAYTTDTKKYYVGDGITAGGILVGPGGGTDIATDPIWVALGDTVYGTGPSTAVVLAGDISNTRKFLRELSVAGVATAPVWDMVTITDVGITPAALTRTDDTNVTLTLGGTPLISLLEAVSLTLGWTGTLADNRITSAASWNAKQIAYSILSTLGVLANGAGALTNDGAGILSWTPDAGGTVTSVGLLLPAEFTITVSPVNAAGTLTAVWANAGANKVFAGPDGVPGTPVFRVLVATDIPALPYVSVTLVSGNIIIGNAGNIATSTTMSGESVIDNAGVVTLSNAAVIAKVLTGYVSGSGTVSAADSILQSIQKLNGNDALKELLSNKATDFSVINNTLYPTVQAVNNAIVTAVTGLLDYRGGYDASTNLFPATGGSGIAGAILKGDFWFATVAGTLGGTTVKIGDMIIANVDTPAQTASNWDLISVDLGYVAENVANKTDTVAGNTASSAKYLSVKGYYDWLLQGLTQALSSKTTPIDTDSVLIEDSADSNKTKKTTFANFWIWIKTKIYSQTNGGDADYSILSDDRIIVTGTVLTAARIWKLPSASGLVAEKIIADQLQTITITSTITIKVLAGEYLNGVLNGTEVMSTTGAWRRLIPNGTNGWSFDAGIVRVSAIQTLTNKTLTSPVIKTNMLINNPANTFAYTLTPAAIISNRVVNLPLTTQTETLAIVPAIAQSSNTPAATTSTTEVMAGIALAFTPNITGRVMIMVSGDCKNSGVGNASNMQIRYGTGVAPTNGAAVTGTSAGSVRRPASALANAIVDYSLIYTVSGLTIGTPYWFDLGFYSVSAGTATILRADYVVIEI